VATIALAGDTMLGRRVGDALASRPLAKLVAPEVVAVAREADLFVLNLECCISERGDPWPDPRKPFFFRAPPRATELLAYLGVDCVTLANNHALDFRETALLDTFGYLADAGIAWAGAGADVDEARSPAVVEAAGLRLAVVAAADHPPEYAAGPARPGISYAELRDGVVPEWLRDTVTSAEADAVLATVHWGPNMVDAPLPYVRAAADALREAGASLVAGHSAHVFHGAGDQVLYDLGDFLDDYATDRVLRNDLGLLFLVTFNGPRPTRVEAVPLKLEYCHTRLAKGDDAAWIESRFRAASTALGTEVSVDRGRLVLEWPS
jgi:poly-gamma-glutamate capsule biosynthesis protein CapA/YwtB (metallophosphatase superfamily)